MAYHTTLMARPPSGGRLDHEVQSLRTRLQHLHHKIEENEAASRREKPQPSQSMQLMIVAPRANPKLSEVVRERREQQRRAVLLARQELSDDRRDSALSQRYDRRILSCQRQINTQQLLTEVRQMRSDWRQEKSQQSSRRHDITSSRIASARSQREQLQQVQRERDARLLYERQLLEEELHRMQHQVHLQKSASRERAEVTTTTVVEHYEAVNH